MKNKVETKVIAATGGAVGGSSVVAGLLLWVYGAWIGGAGFDASQVEVALSKVPYPVSAAIVAVVTLVTTFFAGYKAPHTSRQEPQQQLLTLPQHYQGEHRDPS